MDGAMHSSAASDREFVERSNMSKAKEDASAAWEGVVHLESQMAQMEREYAMDRVSR